MYICRVRLLWKILVQLKIESWIDMIETQALTSLPGPILGSYKSQSLWSIIIDIYGQTLETSQHEPFNHNN
jgi:hypothetical protein